MSMFNITTKDRISRVTLNRPDAFNALSADFWSEFPDAVEKLDRAGTTRALIICGAGKHFCSGIDRTVFEGDSIVATATPAQREAAPYLIKTMQRTFDVLEDARFPVIAAIQGACIGAGLDLAAACDLRFCVEDAYFRLEEINVGMMADVGSLQRLPMMLPESVVKELAFLGVTLSAERARSLGMVACIGADFEGTLALAMNAAQSIDARSPLAIAGSKQSIHFSRDHSVKDALAHARLLQSAIWKASDIQESVNARAERRSCEFDDLAPLKAFGKAPAN